ncbi:MAG: ATP-grasp domain-containing protein [Candidatus Galacturonibacter soehngenii]|nr:ATP-grasp domain-containing protein [Candidatus Galacturonibacter soehngenii]
MYALIVGASKEAIFAIEQAKNMGFTVICVDGDENAEGLKYADISYVIDIRYPERIIDILSGIRPDVIIPVPIGRYLITMGALNDYYHLQGISKKTADICTDKYSFHETLNMLGLRDINCTLISSGKKIKKIKVDYPSIVKPRFGSGSRGVIAVETETELFENLIEKLPYSEDYIIETLVEGTEYGIDAAVVNGEFKLILLREKMLTPFPARQCVGYFSVVEDDSNTKLLSDIRDYMSKVTNGIGLNHCILHADIICNNDEVFLIEISPRPSGHNLHNLFTPLVTNTNMISEYIKYAVKDLGQPYSFDVKQRKCMIIRYFDFSNCRIITQPNKDELMSEYSLLVYECNINNSILEQVVDGASIMNRGYFILEGKDKQELVKISEEILGKFEREYI